MASFNRAHTPLIRYDNDFTKDPLTVENEVKSLTERQSAKSPYEVGTISSLTERIMHLEDELGSYERDVNKFEKMYSGADPKYYMNDSIGAENSRKKDYPLVRNFRSAFRREVAKLDKMPLRYEAVVTPTPTDKVSSVSLVGPDMEDGGDLSAEDRNLARQMEGKPKFVELYSFPGFDDLTRLEKLPYGVSLNKIIDSVINSQPGMPLKKPRYTIWMRHMMMKKQCRSIILDLFWWFLLDRFKDHPVEVLSKFSIRVSENYRVYLENEVPFDRYRDPFFNYFGIMLAQAVYACFCHVFPDSFAKYNESFKERLLEVCGEWFHGTQIFSGSWKNWNFKNLEPVGLRLRMEAAEAAAKEDTKRKKGMFSLDWVKNLGGSSQMPQVAFADDGLTAVQPEKESKPSNTTTPRKPSNAAVLEYKPVGRVLFEKQMFDMAGHTPLLTSSCLRKGANINSVGTHFLIQRRNFKPESFDDEKNNFVSETARRKREEAEYQVRKINGMIRSCHQNEEKRNKKMREIEKSTEEFMADKDRVKRLADVLSLKALSE